MSQRHISIISRQDYYNQTAIISQLNYLLKNYLFELFKITLKADNIILFITVFTSVCVNDFIIIFIIDVNFMNLPGARFMITVFFIIFSYDCFFFNFLLNF